MGDFETDLANFEAEDLKNRIKIQLDQFNNIDDLSLLLKILHNFRTIKDFIRTLSSISKWS